MSSRHKGPTTEWKISLPIELALRIELLLVGHKSRRPSYGARSALVTRLLEQYWNQLPPERQREALAAPTTPNGAQT